MGKQEVVLDNLAGLKGVDMGWAPELALPSMGLGDLKDLEEKAAAIVAAADKTREWVRSTLGQLEVLRAQKREVRELVAGQVAQAQKNLADWFNHEVPAYRRAAWLGLLEYELSRKLNSRVEMEELLSRLVKEDRLKENPGGNLKAYGRTYAVSPASYFEEPEIAEVNRFLAALMSQVFQETGKAREEKASRLRAAGTITLEELIAGKTGKCAVEVPAEAVPANGNHQGFWRGGGVLLVVSDGQNIQPLDAAGSIERTVAEAVSLKIFLLASALKLTYPPTVRGITKEMAEKVHLLWHLIQRARRAKAVAEKMAAAMKALASRATVTPREFFLDGKPGICLTEFQGTWENPDGSAGPTNLFFLVERIEEGGTKRIYIVDVPDHLREFFAPCMGEYVEEGNRFKGLPGPLVAVLQAVYGQVLKASQDAGKAGQIAA